MALYVQSNIFGQMVIPQIDYNKYTNDRQIIPDTSGWQEGAYCFPIDLLGSMPVDGYVIIAEKLGNGLGGYDDIYIWKNSADRWSLGRTPQGVEPSAQGTDLTNKPFYSLNGSEQRALSLHWFCACHNNDNQYPLQWVFATDDYNSCHAWYEWDNNPLSATYLSWVGVNTGYNLAYIDPTASQTDITYDVLHPITTPAVKEYEVYVADVVDSNLILNSDCTSLNGGAYGYKDRNYRGGASGEQYGSGSGERYGDSLGAPALPEDGALSCGLVSVYYPTTGEVTSLAQYLNSDSFWQSLKKTWSDPLDSIISLSLFPCAPTVTETANIILGGVDTGISSTRVKPKGRYTTIDFGTLSIGEVFRSFQDYEPYTSMEIYLPFVGFRTLKVNDIMGHTLKVVYNVDFLTGECTATLLDVGNQTRPIMEERCNVSTQIPLTSANYMTGYNALVGAVSSLASGNVTGVVSNSLAPSNTVQRTGSMVGSGGAMGHFTPFIKVNRPIQAMPLDYDKMFGYPLQMNKNLGEVSGFIQCDVFKNDLDFATENEKSEIIALLREGVWF